METQDEMSTYRNIDPPEIIRDLFKGIQLLNKGFCRGLSEKDTRATQLVWARKLMRFSRTEIMDALERVPDLHPDRAPNLGQFLLLCKKHASYYAEKRNRARAIEDNSRANPELQRKVMKQIYAVTGRVKLKPARIHLNAEELQERKRVLLEQAVIVAGRE